MMSSKLWIAVALVGACSPEELTTGTARGAIETTTAPNGHTNTKIRVNGLSADVLLNATDLDGGLNASRDQITNTSALDFSYVVHDPNPDIQIFVSGSGAIPNSALTVTTRSASLNVTTPFPINRCVVNTAAGETTCAVQSAITFHLTWAANGFLTVFQKLHQISTSGPTTTIYKGQFDQVSASINGTFTGVTIADNNGNLIDTKNSTVTREVDFEPNP